MDKKIAEVFTTDDYGMFKKLLGNRKADKGRVLTILKSIKKNGYILNPIVINEKHEVIDGQGRLEALKQLALPVPYVIAEGAGVNECIAMNINQKNWKIMDYIESYADTGNTSYILLSQLLDKYQKTLGLNTVIATTQGLQRSSNEAVKEGRITITTERYKEVLETLEYLARFSDVLNEVGGAKDSYYYAFGFCHRFPDIDDDMLLDRVHTYRIEIVPIVTIEQAFDVIENVYNRRNRQRVYIKTEYKKTMAERNSWYAKKYLKDHYNSPEYRPIK